jgi:hypothetical protein
MPDEADENVLETDIDRLYKLVRKSKVVKFDDASAQLGKKRAEVTEWAGILEEHKLVELHYPIMGEPEIRFIERKRKDIFRQSGQAAPAEKAGRKAPNIGKLLLPAVLVMTMVVFAYIYYSETLVTLNLRARMNAVVGGVRDSLVSAVPALGGLFSSLDAVFRGQFYAVFLPLAAVTALFVSFPRLGKLWRRSPRERKPEKHEPEDKGKGPVEGNPEEEAGKGGKAKAEPAPEAGQGAGGGIQSMLRLARFARLARRKPWT